MECFFWDKKNGSFQQKVIKKTSDLPDLGSENLFWLHENSFKVETLRQILLQLGIENDLKEGIHFYEGHSKCIIKKKYILLRLKLNRLAEKKGKLHLIQQNACFAITDNCIVSLQEEEPSGVFDVQEIVEQINSKNKIDFKYAILNSVFRKLIENYVPLLDFFSDQMDLLEDRALSSPYAPTFHAIHRLKKHIVGTRKSLFYLLETLRKLIEEASEKMSPQMHSSIEQCLELISHYHDVSDDLLGDLNGLIDLYFSSQGSKLNDIMKTLTIIATIFAPLSFLAGFYSMAFYEDSSPLNLIKLNKDWGVFVFSIISTFIAYGMYRLFKSKGWITKEESIAPQLLQRKGGKLDP